MQRTKHKKDRRPTAILTGDQHLREDQPICRTDNFWAAQWKKMNFIYRLKQEHNCLIISAGDTFNHWKPSPALLSTMIRWLRLLSHGHTVPQMITVFGNHDLPQWNIKLAYKTGVQTLLETFMLDLLPEGSWGEEIIKPAPISLQKNISAWKIAAWHVMTFPEGQPPWPGCEDTTAEEILDKHPQFDLIVTGHNHSTFVVEREGRLLVNPGSLTRQTADQVDHHPCVFLWYAEDNTVEKVIVPHQEDVISREHLDKVKERDERVERFISQMSAQYKVGLSFEENLERFVSENRVRPPIMEIIRRATE